MKRGADRQRFNLANLAWYTGALIVIGSMGLFMTQAWARLGGGVLFFIAGSYAAAFALVGGVLWYRKNLKVPGGLFFTMAVCMTPLAIYGLEKLAGWWPQGDPGVYRDFYHWIRGGWFLMEIGTILAGLLALRFVRFPFLTAPVAFTLWFMSMDLTPLLFGGDEFSWDERLYVSLAFGLVMLVATYIIDRRTREDFAFWGYLFGLMAFWGGLSLLESGTELGYFLYCLINVALLLVSVFLERRAFAVFGTIGVYIYIYHLADIVFKNSLLFPFALSLFGIAVLGLGVAYHRHHARVNEALLGLVPAGLRQLRPTARLER